MVTTGSQDNTKVSHQDEVMSSTKDISAIDKDKYVRVDADILFKKEAFPVDQEDGSLSSRSSYIDFPRARPLVLEPLVSSEPAFYNAMSSVKDNCVTVPKDKYMPADMPAIRHLGNNKQHCLHHKGYMKQNYQMKYHGQRNECMRFVKKIFYYLQVAHT